MRSAVPSPTAEAVTRRHRPPQQVSPHAVEREVYSRLSSHPGLRLQSLVVHMTPTGICLEGRADVLEPDLDVAALIADIEGVKEVINRLMPAGGRPATPPKVSSDLSAEEECGYHCG